MCFLKKLRLFLVFLLILSAAILVFYNIKVVPLIEKYAISEASTKLNNYINQTVYDFTTENAENFNDISSIKYNNNNKVSSVSIDSAKLNIIKTYVNTKVQNYISKDNKINISFPIGNAISSVYFTGLGPNLNFNVKINSSVVTDFKSDFCEAGINQVVHRIMLDVKNNIFVVMPLVRKNVTFNTKFSLTETVIVGDTPDSYTIVNDYADDEMSDIIANYGN